MNHSTDQILDVAGVGAGPFNMSAAALMMKSTQLNYRFFDARESFTWHPGLLFPEATLQVHFLRDLVSLVDPTNPYSFAAFLKEKKRLYRFLNADFPRVMRTEFSQYFQWAAENIPGLEWGSRVDSVEVEGQQLVLNLGERRVRARNLILGTGLTRLIPDFALPYLGDRVFHAIEFMDHAVDFRGKRVALVGGGQTGAELVKRLLADDKALPGHLTWISRRDNFFPLDVSPFVSEIFAPSHSEHFFNLPKEDQRRLVGEQKLASDGIDHHLLLEIYQRLYILEFLTDAGRRWTMKPGFEVETMGRSDDGISLTARCGLTGRTEVHEADVVVLCTGFHYAMPPCLAPILHRIATEDGQFVVRPDFSIEWDAPEGLNIYIQNASRHCRGVADPNLSLNAWRCANIINSIQGEEVFDVEDPHSVLEWPGRSLKKPVAQAVV